MSSIATAVFKVTIGLLVNKGRDKAAEKLKDGDITDQRFRGLIVREIDDIKSKLDGLSRKDLGASISSFKEGIVLLYEVFNKARIRNEFGAATAQAACAEALTLAEEMAMLKLTGLDESAKRKLSSAKERFKHAREKASETFNNEALEISDRILAMQYRVMATILETVDNPEDAVAPCRVCIEELNSLSAVQNSFDVQLKKGIQAVRSLFGKDERSKIISSVCHVNRVIYDVTQIVGKEFLWISPIDIGEGGVDPLRDKRVAKVLSKQGMEHCLVTWSFGQEGKEEHKLKSPRGIATNSSGQFIVGDYGDNDVKMFDPSGQFIQYLSLPNDDVETKLHTYDVATDNKDNIYVLGYEKKTGSEGFVVYEFSNTADLHHKFPVRRGDCDRLTVTNSKVLLLSRYSGVAVYDTDGRFVRSFGQEALEYPRDITAANDGRVMVMEESGSCVHIFSEDGDYLEKFKLQGVHYFPCIAFHRASEHVVITANQERPGKLDFLHLTIFTKHGEFVRSTEFHEKLSSSSRVTVTKDGRIAVLVQDHIDRKWKVLVI